jgi:hypothetical protein
VDIGAAADDDPALLALPPVLVEVIGYVGGSRQMADVVEAGRN